MWKKFVELLWMAVQKKSSCLPAYENMEVLGFLDNFRTKIWMVGVPAFDLIKTWTV